jgi:thymidylate synthase (FAD)
MKLYNQMLKAGVSREEARMVLPQSMYTEYWCTANLLNILKFLKLRLASDAQVEIQEMAKAMAVIIKKLYPESYGAWLDV